MERSELARLLGVKSATSAAGRACLTESDPMVFMSRFAEAVAGTGEVFLGNPSWGQIERSQVEQLFKSRVESPTHTVGRGWLLIPTGGTSGNIRFARHDGETIAAATKGFATHFDVSEINAVGILPLHHVSGLCAWMRCALTGGRYWPMEWKQIEMGALPVLPATAAGWFFSMVPTQLERLLRRPLAVEWLRQFRAILLGGAPAWPELLDRAAMARLPLAPSYGMTETAAMVTALRPSEFIAGSRNSGSPLPHVSLNLKADGAVHVTGESVFRGYFPNWTNSNQFTTPDAGWVDDQGRWMITGRRDAVVITGGEKVQPSDVEAVLRDTGEFNEVIVLGVPDAEWGQLLVAAYPGASQPRLKKVADAMVRLLAPPKRPKLFVPLEFWPANEQGKINRARVTSLVIEAIQSGPVSPPA